MKTHIKEARQNYKFPDFQNEIDGLVAPFGQNDQTFHHFYRFFVLKIVRIQSPPSYMSRSLTLISHTINDIIIRRHELAHGVLWFTCFGVWIIVHFFFIPTPSSFEESQAVYCFCDYIYRHYKQSLGIRVHEIDSDDSRKHVQPKGGSSGWIPTTSAASQQEVSQMPPSHWPRPTDLNFRKTNGNRNFPLTKPRMWHDRTTNKSDIWWSRNYLPVLLHFLFVWGRFLPWFCGLVSVPSIAQFISQTTRFYNMSIDLSDTIDKARLSPGQTGAW